MIQQLLNYNIIANKYYNIDAYKPPSLRWGLLRNIYVCKYVSKFLLNKSHKSEYGIHCFILKGWHLKTHIEQPNYISFEIFFQFNTFGRGAATKAPLLFLCGSNDIYIQHMYIYIFITYILYKLIRCQYKVNERKKLYPTE